MNFNKVASLIAVTTSFIAMPAIAEYSSRIINGSTSTTGTYPFMAIVSIDSEDGLSSGGCGGSLIDSEWVITAAHCFLNDAQDAVDVGAASRTTVVLGSDTFDPVSNSAEIFSVTQVIVHPDYDPDFETSDNANDNDIALIKLDGVSNQSVIKLHASGDAIADGAEAIIMGWGATAVISNDESINPSNTLLEARQQIVSNTSCNSVYNGDITSNMLCASGPSDSTTTDTCQGDSGGPLVIDDNGFFVQVGIVSFGGTNTGPICGDPNAPGVYSRVSQYNSFVQEQIPSIQFSSLDGDTSTECAGTVIDSSLNLSIECVVLDGDVFSTNLNIVPGELAWEWSGEINPTSCLSTDTQCVSPTDSLGLTMTGIEYEGADNTLILQFDETSGETLKWQYGNHFVE